MTLFTRATTLAAMNVIRFLSSCHRPVFGLQARQLIPKQRNAHSHHFEKKYRLMTTFQNLSEESSDLDFVIEEEDLAISTNELLEHNGTGNINSISSDSSRGDDVIQEELRERLRKYRKLQSGKGPAYSVFTNAALDGICESLPTTELELFEIKGIGPKKLELYGDDILEIVRDFLENQGTSSRISSSKTPPRQSTTTPAMLVVPRPAQIPRGSLTKEQRQAADRALNDAQSVFLSGAAGTGKSHLLRFIIQNLQRSNSKFGVCAPTGVAAINVGGSTLHSFFGIGLGQGSLDSLLKKVRKNKPALKRIKETEILLIDEVSMLSSDLFDILDAISKIIRQDDRPFGGMQLIAVGDFFQLPPIMVENDSFDWEERDEARPFCFDSSIWAELGLRTNTFELQQVQRQESGSKFEQFLHLIRIGEVTPDIIRDFNDKCLIGNQHKLPTDGIVPTRLYALNRNVDEENEVRLAQLKGEMMTCKAKDEWRETMPTGTSAAVKKNMKHSIATEMPDEVQWKVGAQVMLTRNKDLKQGLVNGSRGVIESFLKEPGGHFLPIVRFDNGLVEKIDMAEAVRYNPDGGPGCLVRKQIPLRLAWAMTIHKSQGTTLTRAILDISSSFEPGQAYVSLSRVRSINGLWLERPVRMSNVMVSRRVLNYFKGLKN